MNILSARSDYIFKLLFADERNAVCLKSFLHAVLGLPESELCELSIVDPFLQKECADDKLGVLDVKLSTASGQIVDIEIQLWSVPDMRSRISYYLANMVTEQLGAGDPYKKLRRAISIVITDFSLIDESKNHHTIFQMLERTEHFPFNDLMEINVLDLTKIPQDHSDELINWMKFLKAEQEEEMEMLANTNPAIGQAVAYLRELSADEKTRLRNESYLKARRDEWSRMEGAEKKGILEGKAEVARNMALSGVDVASIAKFTGLTSTQIDGILHEVIAQ
ncbi:MAG: Rpn family recombination-promoting nuclease/putative transposase [Oscillospiraceae bacterium]|jgi:predicted transposase/invertase (TIGR01784 family)|nr:Rpn family recombination-promoting nuclease/putative transposase [Oscillospiraceae bacterium]